jgi:hypothetical protein
MSKLSDIVALINTNLTTSQFGSKRFQRGSFNGLARLIYDGEDLTNPVTVVNDGEGTYVGIDDTHPISWYHRSKSASIERNEEEEFGDLKATIEKHNMVMVVCANTEKLQLSQEEIISGVAAGLRLELTKAQRTSLGIQACEINPDEINIDFQEVFTQEYGSKEIEVGPSQLLIAFNYQLSIEQNQACFTLCD